MLKTGAKTNTKSNRKSETNNDELLTETYQGKKAIRDLLFAELYTYYCSKHQLEPIYSIIDNAQKKIMEIDIDFLPEAHFRQIMLALHTVGSGRTANPLSFREIVIRWRESNDARHVVDNRAFQSMKTAASNVVKDSLALKSIQPSAHNARTHSNTKHRHIALVDNVDINQTLKLVKGISHCETDYVRRFELEGLFLTRHCTTAIHQFMKKQKKMLTHLSLRNSQMGDDCFTEIGQALPECLQLFHICFSGCCLTDKSLAHVTALLRDKQERISSNEWKNSLRNGATGLGPREKLNGFKLAGDAFEEDEEFDIKPVSLDLSNNFLCDHGAMTLSKFIGTMIRALDLSYNLLGGRGVNILLEAVTTQKESLVRKDGTKRTLKYLAIGHNEGVKDVSIPRGLVASRFSNSDLILFVPKIKDNGKRGLKVKKKTSKKIKVPKLFMKRKDKRKDDADCHSEDSNSVASSMLSCIGRIEENSEDALEERKRQQEASIRNQMDQFARDSEMIHLRMQNKKLLEYISQMKEQIIKMDTELNARRKSRRNNSPGRSPGRTMVEMAAENGESAKRTQKTVQQPILEDETENTLHVVEQDDTTPESPNDEIQRRLSEMW